MLGALDRQTTSEGRPGKERAGTIHAMLDDDAWCDWYRRCHPVPLDDLLDLPMTTRGHTYFDPGGGSSRIDYVMIYPAPKTAGTCMVDTSFRLGSDLHHRPLEARVPVCFRPARRPARTTPASNAIHLDHLTDAEQTRLAQSINGHIAHACPEWCRSLDALQHHMSHDDDGTISAVCNAFRESLGGVCPKPRLRKHARTSRLKPPELRRLTDVRRHLCSLRDAVRLLLMGPDDTPDHLATFKGGRAIAALRRLRALPDANLAKVPTWEDLGGWSDWLDHCDIFLKVIKSRISRRRAAMADSQEGRERSVLAQYTR